MKTLKFDVYGRFTVEIRREGDRWRAFRGGDGKWVPVPDLLIPPDILESELPVYLDDFYHELARPGQEVRAVNQC
ncbi:DUF7661 family protein [Microbulbifer donghaiensis]